MFGIYTAISYCAKQPQRPGPSGGIADRIRQHLQSILVFRNAIEREFGVKGRLPGMHVGQVDCCCEQLLRAIRDLSLAKPCWSFFGNLIRSSRVAMSERL